MSYHTKDLCKCGGIKDTRAEKCRKCEDKNRIDSSNPMFGRLGKSSPAYIDGRCSKIYYCIEGCGNEITKKAAVYGLGKCKFCWYKELSERMKGRIGKDSIGFKKGTTPLAEALRKISEYKQWRTAIFKRDNYTCCQCGQHGGYLEVNHKYQFVKILKDFLLLYNQFSPIEDKETLLRLAINYKPFWNVSNGETLCKLCHDNITFAKK